MASTSAAISPTSGYVCDTLPPARIQRRQSSRSPSPLPPPTPPVTAFEAPITQSTPSALAFESKQPAAGPAAAGAAQIAPPPGRKLCVRHQRMADEGTNLKLQQGSSYTRWRIAIASLSSHTRTHNYLIFQALDALPVEDRVAVSAIWSNFSSSPHPRRALILHGLLTMCCFSQLSLLSEQLSHLIRIDPFSVLPSEVSLKILGYLDATSLCRAAQVSKRWKRLADDDILWRGICEQHIGQKCRKCGWGLPILEKRRIPRFTSPPPSSSPGPELSRKRDSDSLMHPEEPPSKRQKSSEPESEPHNHLESPQPSPSIQQALSVLEPVNPLLPTNDPPASDTFTRPWKDVYCERLTIERNWRRGRCTVRTLTGHTDGVMCLQFSETLSHPSFPVLITGSYDRTVRVWNLDTGREVLCMTGHTRAVRALQFDEAKLITGSMDHTMRVWDWRTGKCCRTLEGHTEGVVCLNFDSNVLASGSVDTTIKIWNFRTGECFTLRGHRDWVNSVKLWDSLDNTTSDSCVPARASDGGSSPLGTGAPTIDPGKMLFSASDDGTIRLWDLAKRTCVRQFTGHVGQVQSLKLLMVDEAPESKIEAADGAEQQGNNPPPALPAPATAPTTVEAFTPPQGFNPYAYRTNPDAVPESRVFVHPTPPAASKGKSKAIAKREAAPPAPPSGCAVKPVLISGSLDNTIKVWNLDTGKCQQTLFGHIEGVWAVASDKLRMVSGSHDRTIKVWAREEGRCTATLVGHRGAVTCLALGEDKIVSGSDDGDIRVWSFSG
ncbi:hypothetical protein EIP86_007956 [Pleurotus ostreatoroseus]|nr:hypothetical protein EIP86_007956 [Pleurotus ostreatoroseus]